jgi:hypothetical protein
MDCGRPRDFFEKNPSLLKTFTLICIALILFAIEFIFKFSNNQFFQRISKEEKNLVDLFLNISLGKHE